MERVCTVHHMVCGLPIHCWYWTQDQKMTISPLHDFILLYLFSEMSFRFQMP